MFIHRKEQDNHNSRAAAIEQSKELTNACGLVQALHVYIEHCEHQVSFPLKSALFSVRSELADTQASLWTMQHKLTKEVAGAEEQCLRSAQSAVDQSFYEINRDIEKMYKEVGRRAREPVNVQNLVQRLRSPVLFGNLLANHASLRFIICIIPEILPKFTAGSNQCHLSTINMLHISGQSQWPAGYNKVYYI